MPFLTAGRGAPTAVEHRVGFAPPASSLPLVTTAPGPTLNVMSEQLVQLLHVNGLAIVTTDDRQPTEAQMQTSSLAGDISVPMDVGRGTGADQGV